MPVLSGSNERFRRARAPRRDPAPSRLAYRAERLWLTPAFRKAVRYGLPALLVLGALGGYFADGGRRQAVRDQVAALRESIETRPEFLVRLMAIDGASEPVARAIRQMLPLEMPVSSFHLDLPAMRALIEQLDAVASADLRIRKGGVLQVTVRERVPAVLWRNGPALEMLDRSGHRVATLLDRQARPDLPVIAGEGADDHVDEALAILEAARPIAPRLRGLVRVGDRRWDVVLDRDQRILLPEKDPLTAIQRVIVLDQAQDLLGRDIALVDMRNRERPTVRLAGPGGDEEAVRTGVSGQ